MTELGTIPLTNHVESFTGARGLLDDIPNPTSVSPGWVYHATDANRTYMASNGAWGGNAIWVDITTDEEWRPWGFLAYPWVEDPQNLARYRRHMGIVYLRGSLISDTGGLSSTSPGTLPAGFRPVSTMTFRGTSSQTDPTVSIALNGVVTLANSATRINFDGIVYPADVT